MTKKTSPQKWSRAVRYAMAPVAVALSLACRLALNPVLHDSSPFIYFFVAIIVSGWLGGLGPGLAATVLSWLAVDYFYLPPIRSLQLEGPNEVVRSISFLLLGALVSLIAAHMRREQRRAEQAADELRTSEERLRATFDNAALGIGETDRQDRFIAVNDRFCQILGYRCEELLGMSVHELTAPEDRSRSDDLNAQLHDGRIKQTDYEKRYLRKDGSPVWVHVTVGAVRDAAGRYLHSIGTVEDISERKEAEAALRESEERFRTMADSLPQIAWIARPDGYVFWYNQQGYDYTGATPEQVEGWGWQCVHDPEVLPRVLEQWKRSLATGEPFEMVFPLRGADGRFRRFLTRVLPLKDAQGRVVQWFGTCTDVDELKRAEEALRESEQRLTLAQQAARIGSFEWNIQTDVNTWTPELEAMYGLEPGEFAGTETAWEELVHPEDREATLELVQHAFETGQPMEGEWRVRWRDGSVHWIFGRFQVLKDKAGKPLRLTGVNIDITERKRAEDALREADRRKDEFLAMLAHELRNPLAPIRYGVQMLQMEGLARDQINKQHEVIGRQISHMGRLLDDLLEISRITRGKIQLKRELVDLRAVARQALDSMRPMIEGRGQNLLYEAPNSPLPVDGDPTRLEQIIRNLLHNANKYTEEGGCIKLSLTLETDHGPEWRAVVRVSDSGIGIDPEILPRIFETFVQAEQGLARSQGGLGIGLAMVKNLVQLHGGGVEAHSAGPGRGSEFVVRLPLAAEAMSGLEAPSAPEAPCKATRPKPRRVLVVEDNEDAAASLGELLSLWGHEIQTAHDGRHALAAARQWQPEVILLDIGLPGMDGYEVARHLREDPSTSRAVIVALTGYGQEEDRRRAHEAGFDQHLTKPVELEQLQNLLDAAQAA